MYRALLFILVLTTTTTIIADNEYRESVSVDAVNVFVTAKDENGKPIRDLQSKDFAVLENGISQPILDISNFSLDRTNTLGGKDLPLSITFALDTSASMASTMNNRRRLELAKHAVLMLMEALKPEDQIMMVSFGNYPRILTEMTTDKKRVEDLLLLQRPRNEKTAIYDSLSVVLDGMKASTGNKILVLCTDGEDNSSQMEFTSFLEKLAGTDVLVLAFTIPSVEEIKGEYEIKKMAEVTGGYAFFPTTPGELQDILAQIKRTLKNQYSIWYRPSNNKRDGNWRTIQILCLRPGINLYHRPGYFAR